jgi:hypothetical protein
LPILIGRGGVMEAARRPHPACPDRRPNRNAFQSLQNCVGWLLVR